MTKSSMYYKSKARGILYYPEAYCINENADEDSDFPSLMELEKKPLTPNGKAIYIHIPFCTSTCAFCCFKKNRYLFDKRMVEEFLKSLEREIRLYSDTPFIRNSTFNAVYFGGGTPSCLKKEQLCKIINDIKANFTIDDMAEITVEASPSSSTRDKLAAYFDAGVNRMSYGVQTFNDDFSRMLELPQNPEKSMRVLETTHDVGFSNIDIDLIYNLPGQTPEDWEHDLKQAVRLNVEHITTPRLLTAPYTKLADMITQGKLPPIGDIEKQMEYFYLAKDVLGNTGYEIRTTLSSFALPGISWKFAEIRTDGDVLALGPGAGGHINNYRYVNTIDLEKYSGMTAQERLPVLKGIHEDSPEELMRGYIAKKMVLSTGVDKRQFGRLFGSLPEEVFPDIIHPLCEKGLLMMNNTHIRLADAGLFWGGNISSEFVSPKYAGRPYPASTVKQ